MAQDALAARKVAQAERLMGSLTIDGSLQDIAWQRIPVSRDFEELSPQPGTSPQFDTEVRFAYDDAALYIGARMWDGAPDSVLHQLSERDQRGQFRRIWHLVQHIRRWLECGAVFYHSGRHPSRRATVPEQQ